MSIVVPSRRAFLGGLAALIAAPAIVRASSLMPVKAPKIIVPPPAEIIGSIKPIVGAIPDGWIECNGRWLCKDRHQALYAIIGGAYGETVASFNVPDLRSKAIQDRQLNGMMVGRYVINGGKQFEDHKAAIDGMVARIDIKSDPRDTWHLLSYAK